jgi:hypothetical protein
LFVSLGYYPTGFFSYGCLFIPVYIINVTGSSDFGFRVTGYYTNNTSNTTTTYYSIFHFLSPLKVKIDDMSDQTKYITFIAL